MQNTVTVEGYQLSPQQRRIWMLQQADGGRAYRVQCAILLNGPLDVATLKGAVSEVVNRHEILRTGFHLLPGMTVPLQVIESDRDAEFREVDVSDSGQGWIERLFRMERSENEEQEESRRDLPVRCCLVRRSATEGVLVVSLSAMCGDSRSLKNLFHEIVERYQARQEAVSAATGTVVQYVDFAEWQRERLEESAEKDDRLDGQAERIADATPPRLG
ncbi:MAG TPA: condensation domain-containing protein, partial [Blastocatellia bacterium]|nr:condensation domain-containing protein [Blastocatellia bacterium]